MKISIVTISYNQIDYLEEAIKSVLSQDYKNYEYIIVDAGSTDGSRDLIQKYKNYFSKIIFEKDDGPADGLNKGFRNATGDIFIFLNSDDIRLPGALSNAALIFETDNSIDVLTGHAKVIDCHGNVLRSAFSEKFSLFKYAYSACIQMGSATFFKAKSFDIVGGYNPKNRVAWDGELFIDMGIKGQKFLVIDEFYSGFRIHDESITGSKKLDNLHTEFQRYIFKKILGRDYRFYDRYIIFFLRIYKHLSYPRALFERLVKGPIYGRAL